MMVLKIRLQVWVTGEMIARPDLEIGTDSAIFSNKHRRLYITDDVSRTINIRTGSDFRCGPQLRIRMNIDIVLAIRLILLLS